MPTYNVSLPATTSTPQFVCNVPTNATTVTITQSGGGLWGAGGLLLVPAGIALPLLGTEPDDRCHGGRHRLDDGRTERPVLLVGLLDRHRDAR